MERSIRGIHTVALKRAGVVGLFRFVVLSWLYIDFVDRVSFKNEHLISSKYSLHHKNQRYYSNQLDVIATY
jgi:hypothetical protein